MTFHLEEGTRRREKGGAGSFAQLFNSLIARSSGSRGASGTEGGFGWEVDQRWVGGEPQWAQEERPPPEPNSSSQDTQGLLFWSPLVGPPLMKEKGSQEPGPASPKTWRHTGRQGRPGPQSGQI